MVQVEDDIKFGRSLAKGPVNPVFKHSPIPDFRHGVGEEYDRSPANLARHELYMKRLTMVGEQPLHTEQRATVGLRFKRMFMGPKFKDHERVIVNGFGQVV